MEPTDDIDEGFIRRAAQEVVKLIEEPLKLDAPKDLENLIVAVFTRQREKKSIL